MQNEPQLSAEMEKRLSEFYKSERIVCSKCKHLKENHWWNGGGREENSGYDACHSCDCDCMGDEVVEEYIEEHKGMTAFLATALEEQKKTILELLDKAELEKWFDMPDTTENWKTWKKIRNTINREDK